jgi:hypothetical protein
MTPRVTAYVSAAHDLYHTSRVHTGLCALHARRAIHLQYVVPTDATRWLAGDPVVVCLDVTTKSTRRAAIDLRDGPGISHPIIDEVDVYLKRAFSRPELNDLPPCLAQKMHAFGLNYGCRSAASTLRVLRAVGWAIAREGTPGIARMRQYLSTPPPSAFEQLPDAPVEAKVVFQTRLWSSGEVPEDEVEPLNEGRVAMVRALRRAFGDRFVGGLVPTALALERYPNEITPHPSRYAEYLALKKRFLVSIYTRGVEHSLAFKLGETLAASQCLVSVPLRYELPQPLREDENYLSFDTPDEAVDACQRLFDDRNLASTMRAANHAYYLREVEPARHLANVLHRVIG